VFKVTRLFNACTDPAKVSCGVGAYRDDNGKPLVLAAVSAAKKRLADMPADEWTHEYLPIGGSPAFIDATQIFAFGDALTASLKASGRVGSVQSLSGTGALFLAAALYSKFSSVKKVIYSDPTWGNHKSIFQSAGLECSTYRYLDTTCMSTPKLDFEGMKQDLMQADAGTLVLLQACAHNPTGVDPTEAEWNEIIEICKSRNLVVLLDNAYQGFATGDTSLDASSIRNFVTKNIPVLVACSFAKNMGLYGERCGALHVVTDTKEECDNAVSQLKIIARTSYSNPPQFGSQIVTMLLEDESLNGLWRDELKGMAGRINAMRQRLKATLVKETGDGEEMWNHITEQIGMFSYTGLTPEQVEYCKNEGSLFMLGTGRVSMAGFNEGNVERSGKIMADAIKNCPAEKSNLPGAV
jgi:aspartate/tyrosine/aromatic aminotransferase